MVDQLFYAILVNSDITWTIHLDTPLVFVYEPQFY